MRLRYGCVRHRRHSADARDQRINEGGVMTVGRVACLLAIAISCTVHAQTVKLPIKTPIKGLVSMGAYRFVADGGQPDNTLWPLYRAPKIFGGIVIVATWAELQPSKGNLPEHTSIDRALAAVREYNGV